MKQSALNLVAASLALTALALPQIASAQDCVEQADVADATVYAMPILFNAYSTKCAASVAKDGFINKNGKQFIQPYLAQQDQRWPGASRIISKFASSGKGDKDVTALFAALPESALRPFVDGIVAMKIGEEIKVKDCGKIERVVELLAPLPPENVGSFLALLVDFAEVKDPKICPYTPK